MSWSKSLKLKLTDEEIESILDSINASHLFLHPDINPEGKWMKTNWGWSSECDIKNEKNKIIFSGAYFSKDTNLPYRFKKEAKKRGYYNRNV